MSAYSYELSTDHRAGTIKVEEHSGLAAPPRANTLMQQASRAARRIGWFSAALFGLVIVAAVTLVFVSNTESLHDNLWVFILVGFLAQLIDGALGMGYGVSSTTFLLSTGVSPAAASASVHTAKVFTTLVSGVSHLRLGNVDRTIFKKLVVPGIIGGVAGAYVLTHVSGAAIKPFISLYLMLMGARIVWKAVRAAPVLQSAISHLFPLGLVGSFFDSIGGGGWGPIVTTTLVARGNEPRLSIGSVNLAEFFVAVAQALTFVVAFSFASYDTVIAGLIIGGVVAAPLAAIICRNLSPRHLMLIVGVLIIFLSARTLLLTF